MQERLTQQLADAVDALVGAQSVMIVCQATHMCMVARGVEKHASSTVTQAVRGQLVGDPAAQIQLLRRVCLPHPC